MNTSFVAESAKALANGASRELQAVNQRVAQSSKKLAHVVGNHGISLLHDTAAGLQSVGRNARRHPWAAAAVAALGLAALGGYLFSRRVRQQQPTKTPHRRRNVSDA